MIKEMKCKLFIYIIYLEVMAYSCFSYLMKRLLPNFPHGAGMDEHFGHMRSLLQILDFELYEHIHRTGDFTHFYFCYRWFLLDFKRGKRFSIFCLCITNFIVFL